MKFVDYLALVRQRITLIGAIVATVALISLGLTYRKPPLYEASVKLRSLPATPSSLGSSLASVLKDTEVSFTTPGTEAQLVQSIEVGARVVKRLGLAVAPATIIKQVAVAGIPDTTVLVLTTQAQDPNQAIQLANAFADEYLAARRDDANRALDEAGSRLSARLKEVQQRLARAQGKLQGAQPGTVEYADATAERDLATADLAVVRSEMRDLADRSALEGGFGEVIVPASEARVVRDTSPTRSLVFGVLLGGPLALGIVLLLDSLSETVRAKTDAEALTGSEVIGLVPLDSRLAGRPSGNGAAPRAEGAPGANGGHQDAGPRPHRFLPWRRRNGGAPLLTVDADPFSAVSEAYRTASLNLAAAAERAGARTVLVTSAITGEGKTTTLANLAVTQAERGQDVVVVDADLRCPLAHELLGAGTEPGLAELVAGTHAPSAVTQSLRPHLAFVACGGPVERPDQLLTASNARRVLQRVGPGRGARNGNGGNGSNGGRSAGTRAKPDVMVLLDSAPILQAAETLALVRAVDAVVLVVRAGVTRRQAAVRAVEQIRRAGATLLGVVLVGVNGGAELGLEGGSYGRRALTVLSNGHDSRPSVTAGA